MTYTKLFIVVPILSLLSGCAHRDDYTPDPSRPFEPIVEFSSTNSVSLQNGQQSKEQVVVYNAGSVYGNLNAWTDVAIAITSRELKQRGLTIVGGAKKSITMSIQSANMDRGWTVVETQIVMQVRTSDGYTATYIGKNGSGAVAVAHRQIDGAVMRVVHEMLKDPRIVAFLTK